jgi:glycosyltransferase involved in cell wall biosynthesis
VTGEVPDTWPYVSGAQVVVAPLLAPGGTRHKILEGLLAARPVVATPQAADGLEDLAGDGVVLAETPERFAAAIVDLAGDADRARELGRRGRQAVIDRYSWDASMAKLLDLYRSELGLGVSPDGAPSTG